MCIKELKAMEQAITNGVINYMKYEISAKLPDAVFKIFAISGFMHGKKYVIGG